VCACAVVCVCVLVCVGVWCGMACDGVVVPATKSLVCVRGCVCASVCPCVEWDGG